MVRSLEAVRVPATTLTTPAFNEKAQCFKWKPHLFLKGVEGYGADELGQV